MLIDKYVSIYKYKVIYYFSIYFKGAERFISYVMGI